MDNACGATALTSQTASSRSWWNDRASQGVRLQIDNDLFAGGDHDRDYTGGLAITISGVAARDGFLSLDPILRTIDQL